MNALPHAIGYCTNVHAGASLYQTRAQLETYATRVRDLWPARGDLGLGLWLSAATASELRSDERIAPFSEWLSSQRLYPLTFNGFPYGDFHERAVKHNVYLPNWLSESRLEYTLDLAQLLTSLLGTRGSACISTLPLAWGNPPLTEAQLRQAAANLIRAAEYLEQLEQETGKYIHLALEPEPGCALSTSVDLVRFFEDYLLPAGPDDLVYRYLGVCHDVCHAEVMFESQADVLQRYRAAGIVLGKVQVSSAITCDFSALSASDKPRALQQLAGCVEERYLHQTCCQLQPGGPVMFYQDLPEALQAAAGVPEGKWAVHFHVPIYVTDFGWLRGSSEAIKRCLNALGPEMTSTTFEVETYAWNVLPSELAQPELAQGIAEELRWFEGALNRALLTEDGRTQ